MADSKSKKNADTAKKSGKKPAGKKEGGSRRKKKESRTGSLDGLALSDALPESPLPADGHDGARGSDRAAASAPESEESNMGTYVRGVMGHLDAFRSKIIGPVIAIMVLTIAGFFFSDQLLTIISKPYIALGLKLNVFNLIESFMLRVKVALIAALLAGILLIVIQAYRFVIQRVDRRDRLFVRLAFLAAVLLFYGGVVVTYFFMLPMAIQFLIQLTPEDMANTISAGKYLSFVMLFCFGMGTVCELPIVILILTKLGMVTPAFLRSKRKIAIVLIWIVAAIITPTVDPITQGAVAVPLMILYEISILLSKFVIVRKKRREAEEEALYE